MFFIIWLRFNVWNWFIICSVSIGSSVSIVGVWSWLWIRYWHGDWIYVWFRDVTCGVFSVVIKLADLVLSILRGNSYLDVIFTMLIVWCHVEGQIEVVQDHVSDVPDSIRTVTSKHWYVASVLKVSECSTRNQKVLRRRQAIGV